MLQEYPNYERGELELIFNKFPKTEKKIIEEFITYSAISANPNKQSDIRRSLIQVRHIIGKDFGKITLQDLRQYLAVLNQSNREAWTKRGIKAYFKRFLRWHFKDWSTRFDELKDIKLGKNPKNEKKINQSTYVKKPDIEKVLALETNIYRKTFFAVIVETGCRPGELRELKWDKIEFDSDGPLSRIVVYSPKTKKSRTVFIKESAFYLKQLRDLSDSEYVFDRIGKNKPISRQIATYWVNKSCKVLGRKQKVYPYILRHSRAKELYSTQYSKQAMKFLGHSKDMSDWYEGNDEEDVKKALLDTVYDIKISPEKKTELEKEIEKLRKGYEFLAKILWDAKQGRTNPVTLDELESFIKKN